MLKYHLQHVTSNYIVQPKKAVQQSKAGDRFKSLFKGSGGLEDAGFGIQRISAKPVFVVVQAPSSAQNQKTSGVSIVITELNPHKRDDLIQYNDNTVQYH